MNNASGCRMHTLVRLLSRTKPSLASESVESGMQPREEHSEDDEATSKQVRVG